MKRWLLLLLLVAGCATEDATAMRRPRLPPRDAAYTGAGRPPNRPPRETFSRYPDAEIGIRCLDRVEVVSGFYAGQQGDAVSFAGGQVFVSLDSVGPRNIGFDVDELKVLPKDGAE